MNINCEAKQLTGACTAVSSLGEQHISIHVDDIGHKDELGHYVCVSRYM
mgnify:CR=1 FL=1